MANQLTTCIALALLATKSICSLITDPRYPAYLLNPADTPCKQEGDFVHPKNCSWFYRCEDVMKLNLHNKYFFECANGTVFNEVLGICVFKNESNSCDGGVTVGPVPKIEGVCYEQQPDQVDFCVGSCNGKKTQGKCNYNPYCAKTELGGTKTVLIYCTISIPTSEQSCTPTQDEELCIKMNQDPIRR